MTEKERSSAPREPETERTPVLKPPADKEDEATVMDPEINLRNDLNNARRRPEASEEE